MTKLILSVTVFLILVVCGASYLMDCLSCWAWDSGDKEEERKADLIIRGSLRKKK